MTLNMDELLIKVKSNERLAKLIEENHLTDLDIKKNMSSFLSFLASDSKCLNCPGLKNCKQAEPGVRIALKYTYRVEPYFEKCSQKLQQEQDDLDTITCIGYNFNEIINNQVYKKDRTEILKKIKTFLNDYLKGLDPKGLFIHGKPGTGKTFLMAYLANKLKNNNVKVIFAFYPDLLIKLKGLINEYKFEAALNQLKNVDVLMLDDFGAETSTSFVRDEVLNPILQYRMNNHLPVFMTSNLDEKRLEEHLSETARESDITRAKRIMERFHVLMDFIEIKEENHRKID